MIRTVTLVVLGLAIFVGAPAIAADEPALGGYCPVAYLAMNKAVEGKAKFAVEHEGTTYYLANGKAKEMFEAEPGKYAVAYGGMCATGLAHGMKAEGDPTVFVVHDGMTYLFSDDKAKMMFEEDPSSVVAKADENWEMDEHKGHDH